MSEIIFARTRWNYDSYSDFWRLVELSGFPTVYIDEIPREGWRDKTVIITPANGEWNQGIQTDARVIHWQLEWQTDPLNGSPPGVAEVWASDPSFAKFIGARYVLLGSHPDMNPEKHTGLLKDYDAVMLQYLTPRRQRIRHELLEAGVSIAPDGWGAQRHDSLQRARLMLHVHQHDAIATIAPLRWALAAAYHLPVLTERTTAIMDDLPPALIADYKDIAFTAKYWLSEKGYATAAEMGQKLYQCLCVENTFRRNVEAAV